MRVVVDTNIVVNGALLQDSEERAILRMITDLYLQLLVSVPVVDEAIRILFRMGKQHSVDPQRLLRGYARTLAVAHYVSVPLPGNMPQAFRNMVPTDCDDNKFLICAHYGNSQYVISNDRDLLSVSGKFNNVQGKPIKVVRAQDFYSLVESSPLLAGRK